MTQTVLDWIRDAVGRLAPITETPRLDAELILAAATGTPRASLLARLKDAVPDCSTADAWLARRELGEPLAYIFGTWEFFSLEFEVAPPALVPRPETEHLVETVLDFIGDRPASVLDLCTGTGCVAVSIAVNAPAAQVMANDLEPKYVALATRNAARHNVKVECLQGDLFTPLKHHETFDVICANPPYVEATSWSALSPTIREFEDPRALLAGDDGLDVLRRLVDGARAHLRPGGLLALEIGQGQAEQVQKLLHDRGYVETRFMRDLAGIERIAVGSAPMPAPAGKETDTAVRL